MKKTIIALSMLVLACAPSFAKDKCEGKCDGKCEGNCCCPDVDNRVVASTIGKNWEISGAFGVNCYLSEEQAAMTKKNCWALPRFEFSLNKWASPVWGVGLGVSYAKIKHSYYAGEQYDIPVLFNDPRDAKLVDDGGMEGRLAKGYGFNVFVKGNLDFTNLFGGYRERIFNFIGYLGGGLMIPFGPLGEGVTDRKAVPTMNMGVTGRFNVAKRWAIDLNVSGAFVADNFNGVCYDNTGVDQIPFDVQTGGSIGVTYKFGYTSLKNHSTGECTEKMYWVPVSTAVACSKTLKDATDAAAADGEAKAAAAEARAKAAEDALAREKALAADEIARLKATKTDAKVDFDYWQLVNFKINRAELTNREKVAIKSAADALKNFPDAKIIVKGFCDKQTGSVAYNKALSQKRANVVKDYLVSEFGFDADRIEVLPNGGVDYMYFNDKQCSRSAVIAIKK